MTNAVANPGSGGLTFRTVSKTDIEAPVSIIDVGGAGAEKLLTAGQDTMSDSLPVVIASDQTAIPIADGGGSITVDGTVGVSGTVAVSGPLTDTQLRATAVPVSGPLTDTQIRATALPVSGPLTDAQLRATAVPISIAAAVAVTDNSGSLTVDDGGGSLTVDGTVAISGTVAVTDNSGSLTVDGTVAATQSGTWNIGTVTTLTGITNVVHVDDNSGSLTVDGSVTATLGAGTALAGKVACGQDVDSLYQGTTALTVKYANIDVASSGDNQLVAAVSGKTLKVISLFLAASGAVDVYFNDGTANLLGGTRKVKLDNTGAAGAGGFALQNNPTGWFKTAAGNRPINLNLSGAVGVAGCLAYVEE